MSLIKSDYDVLIEPVVTEKVTALKGKGKFGFRVHKEANKYQIRDAVEKIYNVTVTKVNVENVRGKKKRLRYQAGYTASWRKAIVTLKKGEKIEFTK